MGMIVLVCSGLILAEFTAIGQTKSPVRYSDFGAKGDGKTDDMEAIAAAHEFANLHGLKVKADEEFTYFIGGMDRTAIIQTDTDFGTASFLPTAEQARLPLDGVDEIHRWHDALMKLEAWRNPWPEDQAAAA